MIKRRNLLLGAAAAPLVSPAFVSQRRSNAVEQRSPEELDIIALARRSLGREPTEQEVNLWLEQARHIGEL